LALRYLGLIFFGLFLPIGLLWTTGPIFFLRITGRELCASDAQHLRFLADCFNQLPLRFAQSVLGVRDLNLLAYFYSVPLYFHSVISWLLCLYILGKQNRIFIFFPLMNFFAFSIPSTLHMYSPAHFMVSLIWPILFYGALRKDWKLRDYFIFSGLSFLVAAS